MAEHKHGSMDTTEQEKAFEGFITMTTKAAIACIVALVVLAIVNG